MTFVYRGTITILTCITFVYGALSFGLPAEFSGTQRSGPFQASLRLDMDGQNTCNSGAEAGVCYDALNCLKVSGMFGNNCPGSQGVCCLFHRQCGQQSSQEVSYFQNTEEEAGSGCNYRVVKRSPRYCGMRVNLEQLELPTDCQTSLSIDGIHKGKNIGKLRFPERNSAEKICSTEAGIEYAFETRNIDEVLINVESSGWSGEITGKWKIRVTQIICGDDDDDGVDAAREHDSHIPAVWLRPPTTALPYSQTKGPPSSATSWWNRDTTVRPPTTALPYQNATTPIRPITAHPPSSATCWWNCNPTPSTPNHPKPRPTPPPTTRPSTCGSSKCSRCGVRGPNSRSVLNVCTSYVTSDGESAPFIEDLEYGNPSLNDTVFAEVVRMIEQDPFFIPHWPRRIPFDQPSGKREYPWQVGMKVRGRFHCGASIIGDQYILTAAHCVNKYKHSPRTLYLTLGDWDLSTSSEQANVVPTVERVTVHPGYSRTTLRNDLAVLKLTKKIQFADNIRPICLPQAGFDPTHKIAILTSWGRDENNRLKSKLIELASEVTTNAYCAGQWEINGGPRGFITNDMMCMSPIGGDSCNGDSGGPSITEIGGIQYQIGIVSFRSGSCVDESLPGVHTRVTSYVDWIRAQMT